MGSEASKQKRVAPPLAAGKKPQTLVLDFVGLDGVEITESSDIMRTGVEMHHGNVQVRTEDFGVPYMYFAGSSRMMFSEEESGGATMKASGDAMELCTHFLSTPECVVRHGETSLKANSLPVRHVNQLLLRRVCDQVNVLTTLEEELYRQQIKPPTYESSNSIRLPRSAHLLNNGRERFGSMSSSTTDTELGYYSTAFTTTAAAAKPPKQLADKVKHALQPIVIEFGATQLCLRNIQHAAVLTLTPVVVRNTSWFRDKANPVFLRRTQQVRADEPLLVVSLQQYPVIIDSFGHISPVLSPSLLQFVARRHHCKKQKGDEAPPASVSAAAAAAEHPQSGGADGGVSSAVSGREEQQQQQQQKGRLFAYTGSDYESHHVTVVSSTSNTRSFTAASADVVELAATTSETDVFDLEEVSLDDYSSAEKNETPEEEEGSPPSSSRKIWISWTT